MVGDGERLATTLAYFVGDDLAVLQFAAGDDDVGAVVGKRQCHLAPEAAAAAGDEGNLAGQVEEIRGAHPLILAH